jgi:hypothetical protein
VRLLSFHKDFLDNSSEGSITNRRVEDAWGLLDLVSENTDNWNLDKGKIIRDFYFRALGSLVVLSFPQPLNFSSVFPSL